MEITQEGCNTPQNCPFYCVVGESAFCHHPLADREKILLFIHCPLKKESLTIEVKQEEESAPEVPLGTRRTIDGVPCVYVQVVNPCDTLTRQHAELVENEKKENPRHEILDVEDIKRYCPPLIPGCPNDVKKENP
jgi:hypothetical protein